MSRTHKTFIFVCSLCFAFLPALAQAGERLVSTPDMIFDAQAAMDGISIVPAVDVTGNRYTEDYAPSQVLELIRPDQGPLSIGRLVTSCSCLSASVDKRDFAAGERVLIEVRAVKTPPVPDAVYAVIVQLTAPHRIALQFNYKVPRPE